MFRYAFGATAIASALALFIFSGFDDRSFGSATDAKVAAYSIITRSIIEYKQRKKQDANFDDFLKEEWPQDYKNYTNGTRAYDEWETLYATIS